MNLIPISKKKVYWNDLNENYFRKPYMDEAELLFPSDSIDIHAAILSQMKERAHSVSEQEEDYFYPTFECNDLSRL